MIFVSFGELLDERASEQIAQSSGQEDEGEVGLIVLGDFCEVDDDGSYCCDYCSVECENYGVDDEVDIFKFHVVIIKNNVKLTTKPYYFT